MNVIPSHLWISRATIPPRSSLAHICALITSVVSCQSSPTYPHQLSGSLVHAMFIRCQCSSTPISPAYTLSHYLHLVSRFPIISPYTRTPTHCTCNSHPSFLVMSLLPHSNLPSRLYTVLRCRPPTSLSRTHCIVLLCAPNNVPLPVHIPHTIASAYTTCTYPT